MRAFSSVSARSRSGCGNGNGRRTTAFTAEKIAALAPMPNAIVATAAAVTTGDRANMRSANRTSLVTCSMEGVIIWALPTLDGVKLPGTRRSGKSS